MLQSPVTDATQVQLQVRVAEVSRQKLKEFGSTLASVTSTSFHVQGGGPGTLGSNDKNDQSLVTEFVGSAVNLFLFNTGLNTAAYIRALRTNGALRALAEPNLIAMNGQQASFLAGGEFPVPVVQGGGNTSAVSVVFKEYGVRLNFKPTIIDEDHIRLELEPEVSTIDFANGVRFNGFVIPALRTRRARTGVELRDGQSFALAGLLDNNETKSLSKIPVIGDIPILGNLFKSSSFQKQETELMFIITADLVKPVNSDELPQMKGVDGLKNGSPLGVEPPGGDGLSGRSGFSSGAGEGAAANTPRKPTMVPAVPPATTPATTTPATGTPATTTPGAPANGAPANDSGAKTAPQQPAGTPGTTTGATP
jgi:pilus assembly protein CpaC